MAAPPPAMAPKTPNARARSFGSVNVTVISESAAGASSAPKAPCSARAANSSPALVARPPSADAPAKPSNPMMKVRLRPVKSAIRPPSSSRPPNARVYAVITHCRSASVMPSSRWAEGRAMVTIVASSMTMSCATPITRSASQRLESCVDVAGATAASGPRLDELVTSSPVGSAVLGRDGSSG